MSQAGVLNSVSNSPLPPTIPTIFATDINSPAIPGGGAGPANTLQIKGATSTGNNPNGIETIANPTLSNLLEVALTNRAVGSVTTTDGSTVTCVTLPLAATPGVYSFYGSVASHLPTGNYGAGYFFEGVSRTDGTTAVELGAQFTSYQEDPQMNLSTVILNVTGNSIIVTVQGIAATTINWSGVLNYTFIN